jgi:hypothetical protein
MPDINKKYLAKKMKERAKIEAPKVLDEASEETEQLEKDYIVKQIKKRAALEMQKADADVLMKENRAKKRRI